MILEVWNRHESQFVMKESWQKSMESKMFPTVEKSFK